MSAEKILTRHPHGKAGVNISRSKYDQIKKFILMKVDSEGDVSYEDLVEQADEELGANFDGSIPWYITTVKLDLEARYILERIPKVVPHRLRRPD